MVQIIFLSFCRPHNMDLTYIYFWLRNLRHSWNIMLLSKTVRMNSLTQTHFLFCFVLFSSCVTQLVLQRKHIEGHINYTHLPQICTFYSMAEGSQLLSALKIAQLVISMVRTAVEMRALTGIYWTFTMIHGQDIVLNSWPY